jgi:hypothetical protein
MREYVGKSENKEIRGIFQKIKILSLIQTYKLSTKVTGFVSIFFIHNF